MTIRAIMATRRFQKEYPTFLAKYSDLEDNFRRFLDFRRDHRPDEPFNQHDSSLTGIKMRRCHIVHGKAIVLYQLHASELRLISMGDHNIIESGTNSEVRGYARRLTVEDFYLFNVDQPVREKPAVDSTSKASEPVVELKESIAEPIIEPEPIEPEPIQPTEWDDRLVDFATDRGMVYEPRPTRRVLVIRLKREIIAPAGDLLVIDPIGELIHHVSDADLDMFYRRPSIHQPKTLKEGLLMTMTPREQPAKLPSEKPSETAPAMQTQQMRKPRVRHHNVTPQVGRVLVTMHLSGEKRTDARSLRRLLSAKDANSLSSVLNAAQKENYVKRVGWRDDDPRAGLYSLTSIGEKKAGLLNDWPFTVAGMDSPLEKKKRAA